MVGRNIVIGGMTGGAGQTGMVTKGYGGVYIPPPPVPPFIPPITGLPPWRPLPLRRVPFIKGLIILGRIRRPFTQEGRLIGRIRRLFLDEIAFSAMAVKRIEETVSMDNFIVTDDIPDRAWDAFFETIESIENEKRSKEMNKDNLPA